ncbi:MAG: hypothetical protein Faunusvirus57_3 [Faunusvirus sp.]|jgi:hypothetical protein|uniref:Uncharacterized protein n=1 Tax=Faunusvirus sp. TaxID=2487766 RepID=A0A3G4ZY13_9VIRU|nr:MAG: hypothetical protein Faunusvirus57_3 [Faunusvirus sp.]
MIDRGYDIYNKNKYRDSLLRIAIGQNMIQVVKKLADVHDDFADQFKCCYKTLKKDDLYNNIIQYCDDKRDSYKHKIIATMNDASPTNALYQSFRNIYAVQLVDVICDFILLPMSKN